MKLRIKGNSLRLRVSRSELQQFVQGQRIQKTIYFGQEPGARLTYTLESNATIRDTTAQYCLHEVTIQIPSAVARSWATGDSISVSGRKDLGPAGTLEILVEKDLACLDRSDEENEDT